MKHKNPPEVVQEKPVRLAQLALSKKTFDTPVKQ
jgi:hypothetical protein